MRVAGPACTRPRFQLEAWGTKQKAGGSARDQRNDERIQRHRDEVQTARYQRAFEKWCEWMEQECEG